MNWDSSILWGIIGLLGGFTTSFFFYKLSNKSKKIVYSITSKILITDSLSNIHGLNVLYFNTPIQNLSTTTVTIKSVGKDIVEMNDFAKSSPLYIRTNGEFLLKDNIASTLTNNSNPLNLAKPVIVNSSTVSLEYDFLSKNDLITLTFLHTGDLDVTGKLKKGQLISDNIYNNKDFLTDIITYILLILFFVLFSIIYTLSNGINSTITRISNFGFNLIIGIIIVNYGKKFIKKILGYTININNSVIENMDNSQRTMNKY